jgi:uncharacterized protein (TIGR00162 family)
MPTWKIEPHSKKPTLKSPILVEGLPGIGNVGKVAVDFIVDKLGAKLLYSFHSHSLPHSVFVNEDNLVQLPSIELYYKKYKGKRHDLLFLVGDIQPIDEVSCHEFSEKVLDILSDFKGREVITIGGIGLNDIPENPKVYCTANSKRIIKRYRNGTKLNDELYGVVGPIVGVSGLLIGLATPRKMEGISFLAETYGHPMYLGVSGAREILKILNKKLQLELNLKELDKRIEEMETEVIKRTEELSNVSKQTAMDMLSGKIKDTSYIG